MMRLSYVLKNITIPYTSWQWRKNFREYLSTMQLFDILVGNNLKVALDNPHLDFYYLNFNLIFILIRP